MKKYFFKKNNEPLENSQYRVNVRDILNERKKDENEPVSIFKREKSLWFDYIFLVSLLDMIYNALS